MLSYISTYVRRITGHLSGCPEGSWEAITTHALEVISNKLNDSEFFLKGDSLKDVGQQGPDAPKSASGGTPTSDNEPSGNKDPDGDKGVKGKKPDWHGNSKAGPSGSYSQAQSQYDFNSTKDDASQEESPNSDGEAFNMDEYKKMMKMIGANAVGCVLGGLILEQIVNKKNNPIPPTPPVPAVVERSPVPSKVETKIDLSSGTTIFGSLWKQASILEVKTFPSLEDETSKAKKSD